MDIYVRVRRMAFQGRGWLGRSFTGRNAHATHTVQEDHGTEMEPVYRLSTQEWRGRVLRMLFLNPGLNFDP
jgi:hypothetical protein